MMKTLKNFNFKGKKVLVRCDFNVPLTETELISDDFRIEKTLPTIRYLLEKEAKIILMSHLGRPREAKSKKEKIKKFTLKPVAERLEKLLKRKIMFLPDYIGKKIEKETEKMKAKEIILLENLRFYDEEEENDEDFAKKLAGLGEIFINDAFGASHRNHASIVGLPKYLPSGMGLLFEKEIKILSRVLEKPWRPLVVIIGGVKISTKIALIEQFLKPARNASPARHADASHAGWHSDAGGKADHLLLGGEIANAVLIGKGVSLGQSVLEDYYPPTALQSQPPHPKKEQIIKKIEKIDLTNPKLHLPVDGLISLRDMAEGYFKIGAIGTVKREEKVFDIGPETIKIFSEIIKQAKMILWSGPLGLFEEKKFEKGTKEIAESIARNHAAFKIAGGGDTIAALNKFGLLNKFDHVSTGGGAMLEFLSGEKLPGIEALK